jgi:hypothetical protein
LRKGTANLQSFLKLCSNFLKSLISLVLGYVYEFGPFRLHPQRKVFSRGPEPITLTPKVFETLIKICSALAGTNGNFAPRECAPRNAASCLEGSLQFEAG